MKLIKKVLVLVSFVQLFACGTKSTHNPEILREEHFAHIDFLASDSLMGRLPGTPFDRVAAKYIKDYFEGNGFALLGKNGYQFFEFIDHQDIGDNNSFRVNKQAQTLGTDYAVFSFSSSDTLSGAVIFVGYGIDYENDTLAWNDFANLNLTDKWALILRGDPLLHLDKSPFSSIVTDRHKAMVAKEHGAAGVIFVSGQGFDAKDELISSKQKNFPIGIPVLHVNRKTADVILTGTGKKVIIIEEEILSSKKPLSLIAGSNVCARTDIITKKKNTQNVIALVEGSDPQLKHQYIVVGAHFDHLGMGGNGSSSRMPDTLAVHNGADDNASGVSAILEIGHKLLEQKPKRSIVIVAFGAEEMGLLGSRFFVENPLIPLDSIVAMVNIDMLGRLNSENTLQIGGVKTAVEADSLLNALNINYEFNLALAPQGYGPSDHASFYAKNIPVLFFSTGAHADYHTPNDDVEQINIEGLYKASNYIYDVVSSMANGAGKPTFQEAGPSAPMSRHGGELKVRLGIMPDVSGVRNDGLQVLAVNDSQPAGLAGIRKGDIITALGGHKINNIQDYMFYLQKLEVGTTVSVEFKREEQTMVVLVQL
ncbi:MAG: M20/M25/M40 family metallo-hydrolase [Bacteroidales bacterium]|jgi:hypothetical protein|nr:M20/M25/M40 family metallo-hydrolase [Bacteroidales bacterium]MDD4384261.1 M20/M25/M40 family metallo-hydrolase [Bacteroidales bacterium]MDY0197409.1 M20/M25/M40 family metallo-hydrolase [Tenuifilaceae bacterium]